MRAALTHEGAGIDTQINIGLVKLEQQHVRHPRTNDAALRGHINGGKNWTMIWCRTGGAVVTCCSSPCLSLIVSCSCMRAGPGGSASAAEYKPLQPELTLLDSDGRVGAVAARAGTMA